MLLASVVEARYTAKHPTVHRRAPKNSPVQTVNGVEIEKLAYDSAGHHFGLILAGILLAGAMLPSQQTNSCILCSDSCQLGAG